MIYQSRQQREYYYVARDLLTLQGCFLCCWWYGHRRAPPVVCLESHSGKRVCSGSISHLAKHIQEKILNRKLPPTPHLDFSLLTKTRESGRGLGANRQFSETARDVPLSLLIVRFPPSSTLENTPDGKAS